MIKQLKPNIYFNGILDSDLRVFDIIMHTEFGTTYNAYTIIGDEKTALVETAKAKFSEEYFKNLSEITDVSKVDYLIVNHTEPDHAGSVEKLLEMNPDIQVVGTTAAVTFLKEITNRPFNAVTVKAGDEISLGGKTLRFMPLPNLHWPDTMFTYVPQDKLLFTCDSFGAHYAHKDILRSTVTDTQGYMRAAKYYFDNILGPFKTFMNKALDYVDTLDVDMICTGHGPVLDSNLAEYLATYREWSTVTNPNQNKTVVIPFVSAYGYTKLMAEKIAEGIRSAGVDAKLYDLTYDDCTGLASDLQFADGILLGSPTILGDALKPVYELTTTMFPPTHGGKHAAAFGAYGWSGEAVGNLTERLKQLRMKTQDGLRFRFKPSADEQTQCVEFGKAFAEKILG